MRVLVTGGAGYIGSVVAESLIEAGEEVSVLDDLSAGHLAAIPPGVPVFRVDIRDRDAVLRCLREHPVDAVIHMAARSLVGESVRRPDLYFWTNVSGTLSVLDAMVATGVSRFVLSSTASVYGEPVRQPIEEGDPTAPTNPYGASKLAVEAALGWYESAFGLRSISLRYFNAAGASRLRGEDHRVETHLVPLVLRAAAAGTPIEVYGTDYPTPDGTCVRDYVHVLDLAEAHVQALHALVQGAPGRIYNLGCGGAGYSVREVIDAAERVTGRKVTVRETARRAGDPSVLIASSARARAALNWSPQHNSLEAIVGSAWAWMCQHPGGYGD